MKQKIKVDEKEHALDGQNKMNSFRKEKKHCDFIIKVASEEISVHRSVICSRSDYFDAMFSHDTKEKRTGVAEIKGVDRECTVKCVDFMYTGETSIKDDKYGELMHVATLFQLLTLCNAIAAFLEEKLDCISFFATKQLADLYSCQKLLATCNDFALNHFQEIAQLEDFKKLNKEFIEFLLASDNLKAPESAKCKSVIEWTKHDTSNRKADLLGLLKKLDIKKIPLQYRRFLLENEPLLQTYDCYKILTLSVFDSMNIKASDYNFQATGVARGLGIFDATSKKLQRFDVVENTWTSLLEFNDEMTKTDFYAVVLGQHIYVFFNNKNVHRIVYSDPDATWEKIASKNFEYGCAVVLGEMIYTLDSNYQNTMEKFDPSLNKWQILPKKTLSVHGAALAVSEQKIFSISGFDSVHGFHPEVEIFDPATSSWSLDIPLKKARYGSSSVTVENVIYVLGGHGDGHAIISEVEYRCPKSKAWVMITPMKNPRCYFNSYCNDGRIYAIGGDNSNPQTIEEFDPDKDEWKVVCRMEGKNIRVSASIALPI